MTQPNSLCVSTFLANKHDSDSDPVSDEQAPTIVKPKLTPNQIRFGFGPDNTDSWII